MKLKPEKYSQRFLCTIAGVSMKFIHLAVLGAAVLVVAACGEGGGGNKAATDLALSASVISENADTSAGVKIGDITITDPDGSGNNNVLSLAGADATSFALRNGAELYYIGASPDYESKPAYNITITAADGTLVYSEAFTITVTNVSPEIVAVNGQGSGSALPDNMIYQFQAGTYTYSIADFAAGDVLDFPAEMAPTVDNSDWNDGVVPLQWAYNGEVLTVNLTGFTPDQDAALNSVANLNAYFGAGTVQ
jgi:hypothetical protein